ncbi:hypothetical protein [Maribacter antarcticus]|uniref:hypothetical protein n=1 Tax=Maribacter antarcticus TaxID=505250 RepID=UPI00047C3526|nr:hypothetical protein [Maribacter antarcticus]
MLTACSTDEINNEIAVETDAETRDNPEAPEMPIEEPEAPEAPVTGAISFDANFVLNEDRTFTNLVVPAA